MRFQNVKADELEGPIKLPGFADWTKGLENNSNITSVLLSSLPGTGKGAAVGSLANAIHYDIVRCRLSQLVEYPDPAAELKALLEGTEHMHRTVVWLDGLDRFISKLARGAEEAQQLIGSWLQSEHDALKKNAVILVATARDLAGISPELAGAFDRSFAA